MVAVPTLHHPITPEELLTLEDATKYELIDGVPVEKAVSETSIYVMTRIAAYWLFHADEHGLGRAYAELQVRAFAWAPDRVRKPDVAFVRAAQVPARDSGYLEVAPDAVVEVVSPHDSAQEMRAKVSEWLRAGVRMAWVAYPESREIYVYREGSRPQDVLADDEITGEDVLPGFRCRVAKLFPEPVTAGA